MLQLSIFSHISRCNFSCPVAAVCKGCQRSASSSQRFAECRSGQLPSDQGLSSSVQKIYGKRVRSTNLVAYGLVDRLFGGNQSDSRQDDDVQPAASSGQPEFPPYSVIKRGAYDLRLYETYAVVQTAYLRRDEGFLDLGSYMSGSNAQGLRFCETQPALMSYFPEGDKIMQLYLGSCRDGTRLDKAKLPLPTQPGLSLTAAGGEVVAVLKFEGHATPQASMAELQDLKALLAADGMELGEAEQSGFFRIAQYGPLFSFTTRINEVMLRVKL